VVNWT